ncbi:MAG: DNA methyltransferase Dim-2 [Vezdaea acicularis]|nr:MAG: DNA methyltransferase Dim-2 [Vezdaea acicularis]
MSSNILLDGEATNTIMHSLREDIARRNICHSASASTAGGSTGDNQHVTNGRNIATTLEDREDVENALASALPQPVTTLTSMSVGEMCYPKSLYDGWQPPLEVTSEASVIAQLKKVAIDETSSESGSIDDLILDEDVDIELVDFCVYKDHYGNHSDEFTPLHHLKAAIQASSYHFFDGILRRGGSQYYVQRIPFKVVSIGNYGIENHSVSNQVWIQSSLGSHCDIWYRLGSPAPEYARYHDAFMWLAGFAKYFIDYLENNERVTIHDFRVRFFEFTNSLHSDDVAYQEWLAQYDCTDFRRVCAAHPDFLLKEAYGIDEANFSNEITNHPIWREIVQRYLDAIRKQPLTQPKTVVTQYVYDCFKHMPWAHFLSAKIPTPHVAHARHGQEDALGLTADEQPRMNGSLAGRGPPDHKTESNFPVSHNIYEPTGSKLDFDPDFEARAKAARQQLVGAVVQSPTRMPRDKSGNIIPTRPTSVKVGDVVGTARDQGTSWKGRTTIWYAYVQGIAERKDGSYRLKVLWLYEPSDTTCEVAHYPYSNELFMSDNCNCGSDPFTLDDVCCKPSVAFHAQPDSTGAEFFVRQSYQSDNASFVTLKGSAFRCKCDNLLKSDLEDVMEKYKIGDTVLVLTKARGERDRLEPVEIVEFLTEGAEEYVRARRLKRRARDYEDSNDAKRNELVYTNNLYLVPAKNVADACHVRFYTEAQRQAKLIPSPYDKNGTANCFFITSHEVGDGPVQRLLPLKTPFPTSLNQGFDPDAAPERPYLNGMDLYCGGGNFGRGLEDGGAIRNKWAVDYDSTPLHTYHANLKEAEDTKLFLGSVNDFLARAMKGDFSDYIPSPGEVDFISAGSPCQGFSTANNRKASDKSLANISLVASVAAFVDFYRPKYGLMENVRGIAKKGAKSKETDVFAQLICSLVGMGYQVQQFYIDAWSCGSAQSRTRVFISIAAPGYDLPPHPPLTHSHPEGKGNSSIGKGTNGVSYGSRQHNVTPFDFITAKELTKDLPYIGDGHPRTCISHPDHRCSRIESAINRNMISQIPMCPRSSSYMSAFNAGRFTQHSLESFGWTNRFKVREDSKSWRRVDPNGLIPTITTAAQPSCAFTGTILHWDEHRLLTVMEARRAQNFNDTDVLIGYAANQWHVVGNSVDRCVALSLGVAIRESWEKGKPNSDNRPAPLLTTSSASTQRAGPSGQMKAMLGSTQHARDDKDDDKDTQF